MVAKPLNQLSGMPQLVAVFQGWTTRITLTQRIQSIVNGLVTFADSQITFQGIIQPLKAEEISLKPEGQRSWQWLQIHCQPGTLNLSTNDQIVYNNIIYKVMAKKDYGLNGYLEYHVVYEYQ